MRLDWRKVVDAELERLTKEAVALISSPARCSKKLAAAEGETLL